MRTKTLRELQSQGEKAIHGEQLVLLTNRKGPVGIFIPVTAASLPHIQAESERWLALESLKKTWSLARESSLHTMDDEDIQNEVSQVRAKRRRSK